MNIDRLASPEIYEERNMKNMGILLVDDDLAFRNGIERYLKAHGCMNVRTASSGETALELVKEEMPGIVILDLYLPIMNGLKALREILKINPNIAVFMLTCEEDEVCRSLATKLGAYDYLTKPIELATLYSYLDLRLKSRSEKPAA